jgi:hypothetical protein
MGREFAHHAARNFGGENGVAAGRPQDRFHDLLGACAFDDLAGSARAEHFVDDLEVVGSGERDHAGAG